MDEPTASRDQRIVLLLESIFFAGLAVVLLLPLFSSTSWLVFVQDDFLYYLKVAQNIARGHGSTFNGLVATNGYQPLWLVVLVALSWVTTQPKAILAFLAMSNMVAAGATYTLARRLLRTTGAHPLVVFALSAWTTLYAVTLFFYGMEVTLTVPLMLGVLVLLREATWITRSWQHALLFGCLLSAMVLSRIDTLIFCGLLLGGMLLSAELRKLFRRDLVLGFALGLTPLLLYFAINRVFFQTWLPVSGMAKELKMDRLPSLEPWRVFFHPLAGTFTLIVLSAIFVLFSGRRHLNRMTQVAFAAALLFPFVYYSILSCISDWTLWGWYIYPVRVAVCTSFVLFLGLSPVRDLLRRPVPRGMLVASVFLCLGLLRWTRQQADIYAASVEIQQFAAAHPGVYAMGDRAGRVGYLLPDPVVQTEGLMMDRAYLRYVERQTPLRETLARYGVRYYVATAYEPFTGCFQAVEPAKAGPHSAKMRDTFCEQPAATYLHDGITTLIYDLTPR